MVKVKCVFGYKRTWQTTEEGKARASGQELTLGPGLASTVEVVPAVDVSLTMLDGLWLLSLNIFLPFTYYVICITTFFHLFVNSVLLSKCITDILSIHLLMDIWIASQFFVLFLLFLIKLL